MNRHCAENARNTVCLRLQRTKTRLKVFGCAAAIFLTGAISLIYLFAFKDKSQGGIPFAIRKLPRNGSIEFGFANTELYSGASLAREIDRGDIALTGTLFAAEAYPSRSGTIGMLMNALAPAPVAVERSLLCQHIFYYKSTVHSEMPGPVGFDTLGNEIIGHIISVDGVDNVPWIARMILAGKATSDSIFYAGVFTDVCWAVGWCFLILTVKYWREMTGVSEWVNSDKCCRCGYALHTSVQCTECGWTCKCRVTSFRNGVGADSSRP